MLWYLSLSNASSAMGEEVNFQPFLSLRGLRRAALFHPDSRRYSLEVTLVQP